MKTKQGIKWSKRFSDACWNRNYKHHSWQLIPGEFTSPTGATVWRFSGMFYPGVKLTEWTKQISHTVDFQTLSTMLRRGWLFRPDNDGPKEKFTIHRWQDGTHYYPLKENGDPIVIDGVSKFDTWTEAWKAGNKYCARRSK